ncbi:unnamed protein product, partial [Allacma fusca]
MAKELKPTPKGLFKTMKKEFENVRTFVKEYRQMQILTGIINVFGSDMGPVFQTTWMVATTGVIVALVKAVGAYKTLVLFIFVGVHFASGIIYNKFAGSIYEDPKEALGRLMRLCRLKETKLRLRALYPLKALV